MTREPSRSRGTPTDNPKEEVIPIRKRQHGVMNPDATPR